MKKILALTIVVLTILPSLANANAISKVVERQRIVVQRQRTVQQVQVQRVVKKVQVQRIVQVQKVAAVQQITVQRIVAYPVYTAQIIYPTQAYYTIPIIASSCYSGVGQLAMGLRYGPEKVTEELDPGTGRVIKRITERP